MMLVLTRRLNESIRIGDEIVVRVLAVKGNHVRLGIEAPVEVPIVRQELLAAFAASVELPADDDPPAETDPIADADSAQADAPTDSATVIGDAACQP